MTQSIEQDQTESKSPFATVSLIDLNVPTRPLDMWDYRGRIAACYTVPSPCQPARGLQICKLPINFIPASPYTSVVIPACH